MRVLRTAALLSVCALVALGLTSCARRGAAPTVSSQTLVSAAPTTAPATTTTVPTTPSTPRATATRRASTPKVPVASATPAKPTPSAAATAKAVTTITSLTRYLGSGGVSIEAVNSHTGATFSYGATGGMRTGSIVKLYILETLLLQDQDKGTSLTPSQQQLATRMIENSDNAAATALWDDIGGGPALTRAAAALGVHHTVPGPTGYWGLTQTCAGDYVALLRNLTQSRALDASSRDYVRDLMSDVESDQRWGVSAAADPHTAVDVKNGWLATQTDGGRWLVNSVGIITVDRQQILIAVLTQHGSSFEGGIDLVQKLAKVAAPLVAGE